ncbi:MAG: hypothetical protein DRP97_02270 [Candidatus Latescibacterota bacterium]|nr:MAG: hypothetical protein DRP97_02270 [Candidatus Latescibacterota bacterium]
MPIFGITDEIELNIEEKQKESIVPMFETERTNEEVRSYIAGFKWEVTYFHRNITNNELVTEYDPELSPALQDYTRINNFIINVDTPLDSELTAGNGVIDLNAVPNPNDLFIAKVADGKPVIFVITNVTKTDYNNDKVFRVDYITYGEITGLDDPQLTTLLQSTGNEFEFNKSYRVTKTQPLLTKKEVSDKRSLLKVIDDLVNEWSNRFITQDTNFFMGYKDGARLVYDPQMETFIRDVIGLNNLNNRVESVEIEDRTITILDLLIKPDIGGGRIKKYLSTLDTNSRSNNPYLFSLDYLQVDDIIDVIDTSVFERTDEAINIYFPKVETETYIFRKQVYDAILDPESVIDYVSHTKFEQLIISTMDGNVIQKNTLIDMYDHIFNLEQEEQFYYIPILIYIIKYYLNTFTVNFL